VTVETAVSAGTPKILDAPALARRLDALRADGLRIVHAHGVFDLLHIGHIRHLREAKELGDVLVVTITEDRYVGKGPDRPAFPEDLRAEALAALDVVDYVAISRYPTAVEMIGLLRPHYYVKGPDYRRRDDDVTGGIAREEAALLAVGGELRITADITFSSSSLINRYLPRYGNDVQKYLEGVRSRYTSREVTDFIERLSTLRIVVVGEAILDEYVYCDQMGKSSKEPVLAMRYRETEMYPGGALAVANHLAEFCASVEVVTYLGDNDDHEKFVRRSLKPKVRLSPIYKADSPTIIKRRYVEATLLSKMFEVYVINDDDLSAGEERDLCSLLESRISGADVVIAADFGHGLLTPASKTLLFERAPFLAVNTQINAANIRFHAISSYKRADYVCINEGELRLDARSRYDSIEKLVEGLGNKLDCQRFLVTRGKQGVSYFDCDGTYSAPALTTNVVDRVGSGDALLGITAACVAAGMPAELVPFVGNVIGAQAVQIMGNRTSIERVPTLKFIEALLK
jgi:rfaE bifunctional protein kinase chain/domain/rfaE bifunctional protein nucleotidyltransferase chain/domain